MSIINDYDIIVVLGPTAVGKTGFAANLAYEIDGEIISADSRQVYRGMDLGTGKDYDDYIINGKKIPYHLIDIVDAGTEYNIYEYQKDFWKAYEDIKLRGKVPILCGGSGLYIEAVLEGYELTSVPVNESLREKLEKHTDDELRNMLANMKKLHNKTDTDSRKRLIRAIEIETYAVENEVDSSDFKKLNPFIFGLNTDRQIVRKRITKRLRERLEGGLVDEAKKLLDSGVSSEMLVFYGLEYKFLAEYLAGEYSYNDMFQKLNSAIHRFSKRQMTWFRRMERNGYEIHWLSSEKMMKNKIYEAKLLLKK